MTSRLSWLVPLLIGLGLVIAIDLHRGTEAEATRVADSNGAPGGMRAPVTIRTTAAHPSPDSRGRPSIFAPSSHFTIVHAALRELRELDTTDGAARAELLERLDAVVAPQNAAAIARDLSRDELRTDFGTRVMQQWFADDPASAGAWLRSHDLRDEQAAAIGASLAFATTALGLVDAALGDSTARVPLVRAAALALADNDPARATSLAMRLPAGEVRSDTLQTLTYAWAARDPVSAARYVASVDDPLVREALQAVMAKALASTDPDAGAAWLADAVHRPEIAASAVGSIVEQWAAQDPARAAAWVTGFAPGNVRLAAIEEVLAAWRQSDPMSANAWLRQLPDQEAILGRLAATAAERQLPKD